MEQLRQKIQEVVRELYSIDEVVELTRPDEQFGDYSTNVAMKLAKDLGKNPREIAEQISGKISGDLVANTDVAGPGFINITLSEQALVGLLANNISRVYEGKEVVAEYSDPNPFKVLHAGHLYTSIVGDSIANLLQAAGGNVHRVNFGGDVGMHVAKTMWSILQKLGGEYPEKLEQISVPDLEFRAAWLSECYINGTNAYEDDESAKAEIVELNKRVYQLHIDQDKESSFAQIYWTCRGWSYDYFEFFYNMIGSHFDKYYPESETAPLGVETVKKHIGDVYEESDGAIVFKGERHGLHTRVFINSEGLPTYEAKDVGLIMKKYQDYKFDKSVVITGNDITEYMKVVLKSVEQFQPNLVEATTHLTHGIVKLQGGTKMSSRKGNILGALDVIANTGVLVPENGNLDAKKNTVYGAIKYAFLKVRTGGDIIYDPEESVSLLGNSGPYLQYAHARAKSILEKSTVDTKLELKVSGLGTDERSLVRKIGEYTEVVDKAVEELMPHLVCTYLYELAQTFNRFYENNRVVGDERESVRVKLVEMYATRLKEGLGLLGIVAPDRM